MNNTRCRLIFGVSIVSALIIGVLLGRWETVTASTLSALITAIAAVSATYVAYNGVDTWKRQLKGTDEYTLAKRTLLSLYEIERTIAQVRNPYLSEDERPIEKWAKQWDAIRVTFLEGKVFWRDDYYKLGTDFDKIIKRLRFARYKIQVSYDETLGHETRSAIYDEFKGVAESCHDDPEKDPYAVEIKSAIAKIEEKLEKHLPR